MVAVIRRRYLGGAAAVLGGCWPRRAASRPCATWASRKPDQQGQRVQPAPRGETGAQGAAGVQGAQGIAATNPGGAGLALGRPPRHRFSLGEHGGRRRLQGAERAGSLVGISDGGRRSRRMSKIKSFLAADTPPNVWTPWQVEAADLFSLGAIIDLEQALRTNQDWATVSPT